MAKAVFRYIIMSPTKIRRIANLVRGKSLGEAEQTLATLPQRASQVVARTLKSAAANAENNESADRESLFIREIYVDEGPRMRRYLPRARGRADLIRKRTAHLTIVVEPKEETQRAARRRERGKT